MTYDPKAAAWAWKRHLKKDVQNPDDLLPKIVKEDGSPYQVQAKPESVCFFLLEWLGGGLTLPEDFASIGTSAKALKEHTRPDGGVYVGAFEVPNSPGSAVVVYGDPLMTQEQAVRLTQQFRLYHAKQARELGTGAGTGPLLVS